jgi:ATP-dependent helicase HrpA
VMTEAAGLRSTAPEAVADLQEQVGNLVFRGFLAATGHDHLSDLRRYLRAAQQRLKGLRTTPGRDANGLAVMNRVEDAYAELVAEAPPGPLPDFVADVGWLLEELRVSLFAQGLGTRQAVSEKRVKNAVADARRRL